jgi:hypothetical protein
MTIEVVQHIPAFVNREDPPARIVAETQAKLLAHPAIAAWREDPGFYRFSLSNDDGYRPLLMAEFNEGRNWWVVGYITVGREYLTLPEWKPVKDEPDEPYVCPRCGAQSYHPKDKAERYCARCHQFETP